MIRVKKIGLVKKIPALIYILENLCNFLSYLLLIRKCCSCIISCFIFKLEEDPYNEDALNGLSKVEPTRDDISLARALVHARDYRGAVDLITKIIEVSNRK
jgi:hypothetical protein